MRSSTSLGLTKHVGVVLVSLAVSVQSATAGDEPGSEPTPCCGEVRLGTRVLPLKSAIAVWNPSENEVEFSFLPFLSSDKDKETVRTKGALFAVMGRPSPDTEHWATWCPYAKVAMSVVPGSKDSELSVQSIGNANLSFGDIERQNHSWFSSKPAEALTSNVDISGVLTEGQVITLTLSGTITNGDQQLDYQLRAAAPLQTCGAPRCP